MMDSKLKTFISVANLKSYTRAAELLNLTQPAVTQHIKQLEKYYKVKLFNKKGRQIFLTEEGELLFENAKEFEANCRIIKRKLKNSSSIIKKYNIGVTLTLGEFVLPRVLGEYKRQHSNIDVIMHVHNFENVLRKLSSGEFDLGIVEGPFDKSKFAYEKLKNDELVLVVSPLSDFAKRAEIGMEEVISNDKLILREKGSGTRMIFENRLLELGYSPWDIKIYMEVGSIGAIKSLVEANLGYTIISREAVKREVEVGSLVIIPIKGVEIMREFNFIFIENSPKDFVEEFKRFLLSEQ